MDKITTYCGIIAYRMTRMEAQLLHRRSCSRCKETPETGFLVPIANQYFCERHYREFNHTDRPWFFPDEAKETEKRVIKAIEAITACAAAPAGEPENANVEGTINGENKD